MNQPPDDPFYRAQTESANHPSRQPLNQAPAYPKPNSAPNYPPQPGYPFNQGPVNQQGFAPQSYPPQQGPMNQPGPAPQRYPPNQGPFNQQGFAPQRPAPAYSGVPPSPMGSLPPLPEPNNLPKPQTFSTTSKSTSLSRGEYTSNLPEPRQNAAATRPKKLRIGRVIVSVLILLLLVGGGIGAFMVLHPAKNSPTKPVTHTTATTAATNTPQPVSGSTGTVGQPLQAGPNWVVTVTRVHTTTTSDYAPKTGYTYLEISLTLKNSSANTQFVSSLVEFTLTDGSGGQYTESVNDTNIRQAVDGHVAFGQTLTGQIAYQVPTSQHNFVLAFHYGLPDGSSDAVVWNLQA